MRQLWKKPGLNHRARSDDDLDFNDDRNARSNGHVRMNDEFDDESDPRPHVEKVIISLTAKVSGQYKPPLH